MLSSILISLYFTQVVLANDILMFAKDTSMFTMGLDVFTMEHKIELIASIEDVKIYGSSRENFENFYNTFDSLFHYEDNFEIGINSNMKVNMTPDPNFVLIEEEDAPWHLDRITQLRLPLNGRYPYGFKGSCLKETKVTTFILDTGIHLDGHESEFEGRAMFFKNLSGDGKDYDCNSHGTHVAGLVGSKTYGACRDAFILAIKVLDCNGSGRISNVLKGIELAYNTHLSSDKHSVINMSLGGGYSKAMNALIGASLRSTTLYYAAAAGNENNDACRTSPGSVGSIITVMASDARDNRASFSNFGRCADIYTPGVDVKSTLPNGRVGVMSGTSMASPIMAGILNHYIDMYPTLNMRSIKKKILEDSVKNIIKGNPDRTMNSLVYLRR